MKRVWLITGCSSGLGKVLASAARKTGDTVIASARKLSALSDFEELSDVHPIALDVTNESQRKAAVEFAISKFGKIDVLVNNAGYGVLGSAEEVPEQEIRAIFETNFFGLVELTKAVLAPMRKQRHGHILNLSSIAGLAASPGFAYYNATKFAIEGFSEALAQEVGALGIRVTLVEPGPFRTEFSGSSLKTFPMSSDYDTTIGEFRRRVVQFHGKQPGDPERAAQVLLECVQAPSAPLRLPLGKYVYDRVQTKLERLHLDFEHWKERSFWTDAGV